MVSEQSIDTHRHTQGDRSIRNIVESDGLVNMARDTDAQAGSSLNNTTISSDNGDMIVLYFSFVSNLKILFLTDYLPPIISRYFLGSQKQWRLVIGKCFKKYIRKFIPLQPPLPHNIT